MHLLRMKLLNLQVFCKELSWHSHLVDFVPVDASREEMPRKQSARMLTSSRRPRSRTNVTPQPHLRPRAASSSELLDRIWRLLTEALSLGQASASWQLISEPQNNHTSKKKWPKPFRQHEHKFSGSTWSLLPVTSWKPMEYFDLF